MRNVSSSRFTDSGKYEEDCLGCFKLERARIGEICNACVLIVKRWKKLPANTDKDWSHVVDARTGPGIKNVFKNKKKEIPSSFSAVSSASPDKIKHKHVYKRKKRKIQTPTRTDEVGTDHSSEKDNSYLLDFIDTSYWRRFVRTQNERVGLNWIFILQGISLLWSILHWAAGRSYV